MINNPIMSNINWQTITISVNLIYKSSNVQKVSYMRRYNDHLFYICVVYLYVYIPVHVEVNSRECVYVNIISMIW